MKESQNIGTFQTLAVCLLAAAMLAVLPASATRPVRDAVRVSVSPGQRCVAWTLSAAESRWQRLLDRKLTEHQQKIETLQARLAQSQLRERQAQLLLESATRALANVERHGATPFVIHDSPSLVRQRAVRARILGREIISELKSRRILDRGHSDGVGTDLWVLNGDLPIVEAGSELSVTNGLPVFAGRCIVGRIVETGRWTSSLQYLTDPGFRARAVLGQTTTDGSNSSGFAFGAEGLLEGRSGLSSDGLCELTQIPSTEHVEVGMPVYSPTDRSLDAAMLFGHVVSAEVSPGALHWIVVVRPEINGNELRSVEIVVPEINDRLESPLPEQLTDSPRSAPSTGTTGRRQELSESRFDRSPVILVRRETER